MREFDFIPYLRPPRIGAVSGLVLSTRLIRAAQGQAVPDAVVEMLKHMRVTGEALRAAVRARKRNSLVLRRPVDRRFDAAWGACYRRMEVWTRLEGEPEAARAQELLTRLFPDKLRFLLERYEAEWVHSRELLTQIEEEQLEAEIVELVGERTWALVLDAHKQLGEALGLEGEIEAPASDNVGAEIRALAKAIAGYGRVFAGSVQSDEQLDLFVTLMRPLDELRAQQRNPTAKPESEVDADEDLFELEEANVDLDEPLPEIDGTEDVAA